LLRERAEIYISLRLDREFSRPTLRLCKAMLQLCSPDRLQMWAVDKCAGNVKNDAADLAEPIAI